MMEPGVEPSIFLWVGWGVRVVAAEEPLTEWVMSHLKEHVELSLEMYQMWSQKRAPLSFLRMMETVASVLSEGGQDSMELRVPMKVVGLHWRASRKGWVVGGHGVDRWWGYLGGRGPREMMAAESSSGIAELWKLL
jgi:hypothetical protein